MRTCTGCTVIENCLKVNMAMSSTGCRNDTKNMHSCNEEEHFPIVKRFSAEMVSLDMTLFG